MSKTQVKAPQRPVAPLPIRPSAHDPARSRREAVESIVIAVILAFLFRAFEAEAFVIPTGSMAPTLLGQHKDVECPQCGFRFHAGASQDAEMQRGPVVAAKCPICFFDVKLDPQRPEHRSYTGDRILVNKFAYEPPFGHPKRWDVIVFKFPGNAKQNYIKRLIGLPQETVRIWHGDIYIRDDSQAGSASYHIMRKPPAKMWRMMQLVDDSSHRAPLLHQVGWPDKWQPSSAGNGWETSDAGQSYRLAEPTGELAWLRFGQHYLSHEIWQALVRNEQQGNPDLGRIRPYPVLVTDFYAYNAQTHASALRGDVFGNGYPKPIGAHWVGDLAVDAKLQIESDQGELQLDLVRAGRHHRCVIDVASGRATLTIDNGRVSFQGEQGEQPVPSVSAQTPIRGSGSHDIRFANIDQQLVLWVDGDLCQFDGPTTFLPPTDDRPLASQEDLGDLTPVRLGARNAILTASRLRVFRDIYYIATDVTTRITTDYHHDNFEVITETLLDPAKWRLPDNLFDHRREVVFPLKKNQFFVLGDNSPYSRDGRLWDDEYFVHRDLLIGKAVLIYWPHAWRLKIPGTDRALPIIPNVQRMGFIR